MHNHPSEYAVIVVFKRPKAVGREEQRADKGAMYIVVIFSPIIAAGATR